MKTRAVSEVAGTMLLIGVVVLGMIIVNLVVFSTPSNTRVPSLEATMANRSSLITIVHQGGDSIAFGDFKILVDGMDRTGEFVNSGTFPWSVGETLVYNGTALPRSAIMMYNGTGAGEVILLQARFPWGVYVGRGAETGGGAAVTTPVPTVDYPWYDCSWGYRKNITIDHTKVSGTQTDFPVLISLSSDADLSSSAQSDGDDILFTSSDGTTKLSHEIESYSSGTLVAWVKVPSINSATDTTIMMYYGNSGASSQQDAANVWDASYRAVWHLDEAVTDESTSGTHEDSTVNNNDGTQTRNGPVSGKIGGAQDFDGTNDWIQGPNAASLDMSSQVTVEAWVYLANSNNNQKIVGKTSHPPTGGYLLGVQTGGLYPECWDSSGTDYTFTSGSISSSSWTHLALTWTTGGSMVGYVNGAQVNSIPASGSNLNSTATSGWMRAGTTPWSYNPSQFFVNGRIDEVRISSSARSAQWILTEYANQNSPGTFSSVGSQEAAPSSCSGVTPTPTPTLTYPWYDCDWGYRKNITIDHTKVSGTQTNFPVLVSLSSDADLSSRAQSDGDDILFTAADGTTKLSHEIESYSSGTLVAWVKVPSINAVTDTTIMMYYGNNGASNQQDTANVWDSNYKGVWHLKESGSGSSGEFLDSTSNNNDGQGGSGGSSETPDMTTSGKIGNGQDFNDGQWINVPNSGSLQPTTAITLSGWIYLRSYSYGADTDAILRKGEENPNNYNFRIDSEYVTLEFDNYDGGDGNYIGTTTISTGSWYHIVGTWQSGSQRIVYLNGAQVITDSGYTGPISTDTRDLYMGGRPWEDMIDGRLDETRISNVVRSAQWIATEYANQNSPATFYAVGSQVTSPPSCGSTPPPAGWYDCDWGYRKNLTIDHTKVSGTQTDFPVLVSLSSDADLTARAQSDGDDILFTADDGTTKLSHEIESYSSGTLVAWVKVPSINAVTDTTIMMYYGNSGTSSQQDVANVWTNSYAGVWHLKETTGGSGSIKDSSSNGNHGTDSGSPTLGTTGKMGKATGFDGTDDRIAIADPGTGSVLDFGTGNSITVSAWVRPNSLSGWTSILLKGDTNGGPSQLNYGLQADSALLAPNYYGTSDYNVYETGSNVLATGNWYYSVWTYTFGTAASANLYVNGASQAGSWTSGTGNEAPVQNNYDLWFGDDWYSERWNGIIDEVRISRSARPLSWIQTEYNNQNSPGTFVTAGSQVASGCSGFTPPPGWYDCDWGYRKNITINHANVVGTQADFPVLVSITDSDLSARAQSDGDDILFTSSDGQTKLSHEIESYTSASGALVAWVKVPSINSVTDTTIMMYYGNSGTSSQQNRNGVWDSNFVGVWHLADTSGATQDSTSYGTGGTVSGSMTRGVTGKIGKAFDSSPTNGAVSWGDPGDGHLDFGTGSMTLDLWINIDAQVSAGAWPQPIWKGNTQWVPGYWLEYDDDNNIFYFGINDGASQYGTGDDATFSEDTWYHIVGVVDRPNNLLRIYKNGAQQGGGLSISGIGSMSNSNSLSVSASSWGYFDGLIDEIRLSNTPRSANWITTEYNNMNSPGTFISTGSQVESGCSVTPTPTPVPFDPCSWSGRKKITIDHTKVSGTQTDFPVLVNISSDSDLATDAQDDGDDIVFTASDGSTQIPHEIESFDGNTGALTAWVKVPSINSGTDTDIYLYYGNAGTTSQQDAANVWDANYKGVWHMAENPSLTTDGDCGGGSYHLCDSTSRSNDGTMVGSMTLGDRVSGKVGTAWDFDGNDDRVRIKANTDFDPNIITVEAWIRTSAADERRIMVNYDNAPNEWYFTMEDYTGGATVLYTKSHDANENRMTPGTYNDGTWHHAVAIADSTPANIKIYMDGSLAAVIADPDTGEGWAETDGNTPIIACGMYACFLGQIDEVRVSAGARSAGWILTEYNNQNSPSTFISLGVEDTNTCIPPTPTPVVTPSPTPAYPWYGCGWSYRKNITINHLQVSGTQTNFPVLVNLSSDSSLAAHAQADGDDILFTSANGVTKIPHEIESYTSTTGALIAWVNVSSINSATDTTILMYYGNPGASNQQLPTQVWDSNYKAVWHFDGDMLDSTLNGNTGTSATTSEQAGGKIANYRNNPGTAAANNITIGDGASVQNLFAGGGTFEAWVYPVAVGNNEGRIGDKSSATTSANGWSLSVNTTTGSTNSISFKKGFSTAVGVWNSSRNSITFNAWNHVAVTYNNDSTANNPTIYINGASANIMRRGTPTGTPQSDIGRTMRLFNYVGALTRGLQGNLDEVRASRTIRSASWILTEYNNQNSPSTFISVGPEFTNPCSLGPGPFYAQGASQHYGAAGSGTVTLPFATTAGRLLVVSIVFDSVAVNVASVSDSVNGAVYNLALAPTTVGGWGKLYTYYVNNSAAGGPITATITLSGAPSSMLDLFFTEYGGIALALPLDQTSAGTGTGTSMNSGSQTTTTASEMIYGFGADDWDCHGTSPYVDRQVNNGQCVMDRNVTATGSYSVAATQSPSGDWALQMVTFRGA